MNVGNSLGLGVGKHLAASYPYSAGIGVGAVAYFIPKGILRPTILKWASAPRFLFYLCRRGAGGKILLIMEDRLVAYAQAVIEAYNAGDDLAMQDWCKKLNQLVCEFPADCIKTGQPYLVSIALFYALNEGYCYGGEALIHFTYYCMLKAYRSDYAAITMYAFLFVDANMGILLTDLKDDDGLDTALGMLMLQLLVFFKTFEHSNYHVELDAKTMKTLKSRVDKWKGILRPMEKMGGAIDQIASGIYKSIDEYMREREGIWSYRQAHYKELFIEEYISRL